MHCTVNIDRNGLFIFSDFLRLFWSLFRKPGLVSRLIIIVLDLIPVVWQPTLTLISMISLNFFYILNPLLLVLFWRKLITNLGLQRGKAIRYSRLWVCPREWALKARLVCSFIHRMGSKAQSPLGLKWIQWDRGSVLVKVVWFPADFLFFSIVFLLSTEKKKKKTFFASLGSIEL